ncbi:serine/threonine protein kinase [bacterium]|nr:serine/threonine protein kinase [bacterium]MBU1753474.1 serine/threonine protein kinase [bacterium]
MDTHTNDETAMWQSPVKKNEEYIGGYEILEKIGEGGMATVYKARHKGLDIIRAVKVLSPDRARDEEFLKRFEREAKIVAQLQHPNIIAVYDVGMDKGAYYIEMEYVDGVTLKELIKNEKLPVSIGLLIVAEVCQALEHAHKRQFSYRGEEHHSVVHRDIKPSNIMISRDGRVKLTDFGIARAVDVADMTKTATIVGTAPYMSREQIDGEPIDHKTDIYSLGVVLYEILTGGKPFGEEPVSKVMKNISIGQYSSPHKIDPTISKEVERIITRAMALNPKDRYNDALEMYQAIHNYLSSLYKEKIETTREIQKYLQDSDNYSTPVVKKSSLSMAKLIITIGGSIATVGLSLYLGYLVYGLVVPEHTVVITSDVFGIKATMDNKTYQTHDSCLEINHVSQGKHLIEVQPINGYNAPVRKEIEVTKPFEQIEVKFLSE